MGSSGVEQNRCNCKDGVYKKLTEYYVQHLMRFLSVDVIDAASSKRLRWLLLRSRGFWSTTSYSRCGGPGTPAGVHLGWCLILVVLIGAIGIIVAKLPAVEASPVIAHHSTYSTVIASLLIHGVLTPKGLG